MDYPSLDLGHAHLSERDVSIVGLDLKVYGLDEIAGSSRPLAVVIAMHGRCNSLKNMVWFANGLLGEMAAHAARGRARPRRDVLVVTLDQRNHGTRLKSKVANLAFDENPRHLVDMSAMHDVSLIMDFLAAYLFPAGERVIEEFVATGISLGGNATWKLLRDEPRVRVGVPIIGLPFSSFAQYLAARARDMGLAAEPPLYPPALRPLLETPSPVARYAGKKILSMHGAVDRLVPYAQGKADLDAIAEAARAAGSDVDGGSAVEVWVQADRGHVCTPEMVARAAEWIWRWAVADAETAAEGAAAAAAGPASGGKL